MDLLSILYYIGVLFLCLLVTYITYLYYTWPYSLFKQLGIPGPKPKPLIGTSSDFGKKAIFEIDAEFIAEYGKVVGTFEGWNPSLIITDVDMLKEIYIRDFESFCDRPHMKLRGPLKYSIIDVHGSEPWKRQRTQLSKYFSSGKMKMSMTTLNRIIGKFIAMLDVKYENGEKIEAKGVANMYTMDVLCTTAFGVEVDSINKTNSEIVWRAKELMKLPITSPKFIISVFFPTLAGFLDYFAIQTFDVTWFVKFVKSLLKQRQLSEEECPDFVNTLMKARKEEDKVVSGEPHTKGMNDDEIIANAVTFLLGGFDTSANTLSFLIYNLTVNEGCQEKVHAEIQEKIGDKTPTYENVHQLEYLDMCYDESLRLHPILVRLSRACVQDTVVKDTPIKKGMQVVLPVYCIHHDPEIYPEPEKFDPERFTAENKKSRDPIHYCPFGVGPKHCIGMRLAILEIKLCIVRILQKYKLKRNDKTQIPLKTKKDAIFLTPQDGIWFSLEKR